MCKAGIRDHLLKQFMGLLGRGNSRSGETEGHGRFVREERSELFTAAGMDTVRLGLEHKGRQASRSHHPALTWGNLKELRAGH